MSFLDTLGLQHDALDKSSKGQDYLKSYEMFLNPRGRPVKLLEMGVRRGESLRLWKEWFWQGQIVGMDINPECLGHTEDRIAIEIGDQSNVADLERVVRKHGPFDVIVDDAGHEPDNQIFAFQMLLPQLAKRGVYILEDIGIPSERDGGASIGDYRASLSMARLAHRVLHSSVSMDDEFERFIEVWAPQIEMMAFIRHSVITKIK